MIFPYFLYRYNQTLITCFQASLASGVREIESLRRELEASMMERVQLQSKVEELLEKATDAERLRAELERLKVRYTNIHYS